MRRRHRGRWKLVSAAIAVVVLLPLLAAEAVFRLLPVFGGIYLQPVDAAHPVARMEPDRDFTYSLRPSMDRPIRKRVNNAGFVSADDYDPGDSRPLLAVIGDSFVEALMVPHADTLGARLQQSAGGKARVYSFAISGAPLSQYLVWARHARDEYRADALAFVVVANDFDQSLLRYMARAGYHYFDGDLDRCALDLVRIDLPRSRIRWVVRSSALAQYLVFNLGITGLVDFERLRALAAGFGRRADAPAGETAAAGTVAPAEDLRVAHSRCAITAFFERLPAMAGLPPARIAFVVDGLRDYRPAGAAAPAGYFAEMRAEFMDAARRGGYQVVDMEAVFSERHARTGRRFEFPDDNHWSGEGHAAVAEALAETAAWRELLAR